MDPPTQHSSRKGVAKSQIWILTKVDEFCTNWSLLVLDAKRSQNCQILITLYPCTFILKFYLDGADDIRLTF